MYLEVSDRPKNLRSVQHMFEILCDNNRLSIQLLLSSELGLFEVVTITNDKIPMKPEDKTNRRPQDRFSRDCFFYFDFFHTYREST